MGRRAAATPVRVNPNGLANRRHDFLLNPNGLANRSACVREAVAIRGVCRESQRPGGLDFDPRIQQLDPGR